MHTTDFKGEVVVVFDGQVILPVIFREGETDVSVGCHIKVCPLLIDEAHPGQQLLVLSEEGVCDVAKCELRPCVIPEFNSAGLLVPDLAVRLSEGTEGVEGCFQESVWGQ